VPRFIAGARVLAGALLVLQSASGVSAQETTTTRKPRAFPALFGPTEAELNRPRRLYLSCSIYDAADDNTFLSNDTDVLDPTLQSNRWYTGANVSLAYTSKPRRNLFSLNLSSSARYYSDLHEVVTTRHSGAFSLDLQPAFDWRVQLSSTASYSPYYDVVLGPTGQALSSADMPPISEDASVSKQHAMQYGSFVGVTHNFAPETMLALNYGVRYRQIFEGADTDTQRAGFQFTHAIAKDVAVKIGYAYGLTTTGGAAAAPIRNNDLDIGLNYGRTFAPSVRTSVSFTTGSTIVSAEDGQHFRVTGSGRLMRRLSPTWTAMLSYDRGLQVPDGATRPFFSDTVSGTLGGYLGRRVNVRLQPSYSHGVVGLGADVNPYDAYTNTSRIEVAISRRVALYGEHFFYRYRFASDAGLPAQLMPSVDRQGARMGLTLWAPIVR
jgi:hypothetical protein